MSVENNEPKNLDEPVSKDKNLEENKKREQFGNRHLTNEQNVFDFNAW